MDTFEKVFSERRELNTVIVEVLVSAFQDNFSSNRIMEYQVNSESVIFPSDATSDDVSILKQVKEYTMTSVERQLALIHAVRHIVRSGIPGCFVECGVWKGGSAMAAALTFIQEGDMSRHLYLFDTFEGMTNPTVEDKTYDGILAKEHLDKIERGTGWWCYSPFDEVKANMESTGFPMNQIHLIKGPVETTIPEHMPAAPIALLRLDTDWYESTKHELIHLFPLLHIGGILIVDDYGHWQGSKKAVDEYFVNQSRRYFIHRIDYTGRLVIKENDVDEDTHSNNGKSHQSRHIHNGSNNLEQVEQLDSQLDLPESATFVIRESEEPIHFPEGDYISPGLQQIKPDRCFPKMLIGNTLECSWPFLRREIPHNWYIDERYPHVGFINRDEAHIIYNSALMFRGKRGLEVGCWMGWSACHIGLAGVELDVIDPILQQPELFQSVRNSLRRAGVLSSVRLIPGSSPEKVEELAEQEQRRWAFIFIDGDHESPHPLNDVKACEPFAENNALILFHDLVSPGVAEGLEYLKKKGWNVMLYHTMQIMGVAWRGNVEPVRHEPDPQIFWQIPSHLRNFCGNLGRESSELNQQIEAISAGLQAELDWLRLQLKSSQEAYWQVTGEKAWFEAEQHKSGEKIDQLEAKLSQNQDALSAAQARAEQVEVRAAQAEAQIEQINAQLEQANVEKATLESKLQQTRGLVSYLQRQLFQAEETQSQLAHVEQLVQSLRTNLRQAQRQIENLRVEAKKKSERLQLRKENLERKKAELSEAQGRIAAMETSKFWKARKIWFNVKRLLGLKVQE